MYRTTRDGSFESGQISASFLSSESEVNALDGADRFVTAEPTPKRESRRGWRRRRVRRGKS